MLDKKGKGILSVENWRHISLLNTDYKLLTKCVAERIKIVINKLIHNDQTGFIKGRDIFGGIRAILVILDETDRSQLEGILITLDFEKAFDSLAWEYLFKTLEIFNFGDDLLCWIKTMLQRYIQLYTKLLN